METSGVTHFSVKRIERNWSGESATFFFFFFFPFCTQVAHMYAPEIGEIGFSLRMGWIPTSRHMHSAVRSSQCSITSKWDAVSRGWINSLVWLLQAKFNHFIGFICLQTLEKILSSIIINVCCHLRGFKMPHMIFSCCFQRKQDSPTLWVKWQLFVNCLRYKKKFVGNNYLFLYLRGYKMTLDLYV